MKKKYVILGSILALFLSVSVLSVSIFAASQKDFSVNNVITFNGQALFTDFDLTAKITGTVDDTEERLTYNGWSYSEINQNQSNEEKWIIQDPIKIKHEGMNPKDAHITYTFTITNKGKGRLEATLNKPTIADWLKVQTYVKIENEPEQEKYFIEIPETKTATIRMKLSVDKIPSYGTQQSLNFNITFNNLDKK